MANDKELDGVESSVTGDSSPKKKESSWKALVAFLAEHAIEDEQAIDAFKSSKILSLGDLLEAKADEAVLTALKAALTKSGSQFAIKRLDAIDVASIRNTLFYLKNPDAQETTQLLVDFLADTDVLPAAQNRDRLIAILLEHNVTSLAHLQKLKASSSSTLEHLAAAITTWNAGAGESFRKITAGAVAHAAGEPLEVNEDLQVFLREKAKLPVGSEAVLAKFGVTTLQQLKAVKEDPDQAEKLAKRFHDSGILKGKESFEKITVEDIDEEVGTVTSPAAKEAKKKEGELRKAIDDVKKLRKKVEDAAKENMAATVASVAKEYDAVLSRVKDTCDVDFEAAGTTAQQSQADLKSLLDETIQNAETATNALKYVDKTQMPLTKLMRRVEMLCGALITPAGITMKRSAELVQMPALPEQLAKAGETQESTSIRYKGAEIKSFAFSYASQAGSSVSTSTDAAAAGFVGTGMAAVSAAASYADARKASRDQETFNSAATATYGEIRYVYVPKQTVQFKEKEIRLSSDARQELMSIASTPAGAGRAKQIRRFYERFGSHFFTRYSLGGRYEFNATGQNTSASGKEKLETAVSNGTDWAVSSSASYLGLGGAVKAAAAVVGSTTSAQAQADQLRFSTDNTGVSVSIKVAGGAGLTPRDVWSQSLAFNSTWAVICRAEPTAIWDIVERIAQTPPLPLSLAPALEEVWVREVFREAVRDTNPSLFARIGNNPAIKTCEELDRMVRELQAAEPPIQIVIVQQTSTPDGHPKIVAQSTTKGLKLIGGGASVDYGDGYGNMLTGSYPAGEGWAASSKEHLLSSPAKVTAYAVYLVDPDNIWDVKRVEVKTDRRTSKPQAMAVLPAGYSLTGGGALIHGYGSHGVMLTQCGPAMIDGVWTGWTAEGKDHMKEDAAYATAWAIGIRSRNMLPGAIPKPTQLIAQMGSGRIRASASAAAGDSQVVIGGGAAVTYHEAGAFLTSCFPAIAGESWSASAKDHMKEDTLSITTWAIARTGEMTTLDAVKSAAAGR
jgi:hypothetical protein